MTEGYCCLTELSLEHPILYRSQSYLEDIEHPFAGLTTIIEDDDMQRGYDHQAGSGLPTRSYHTSDASYSGSPSPLVSTSDLSPASNTPEAWSTGYRSPLHSFPTSWYGPGVPLGQLPGQLPGQNLTAYPSRFPEAIDQLRYGELHQVASMPQLTGRNAFSSHASPAVSQTEYSSLDSDSSLMADIKVEQQDTTEDWTNTVPYADYGDAPALAPSMEDLPRPSFSSNPALSPDLRLPPSRRRRASSTGSTVAGPGLHRQRRSSSLKEIVARCTICGKPFNRLYNCKVHMQTHRGDQREKPYVCEEPECGMRCNRQTDLARHRKSVHEKRKDHKCNMCDKVFARRDTLKRHEEDGCRARPQIAGQQSRNVRENSSGQAAEAPDQPPRIKLEPDEPAMSPAEAFHRAIGPAAQPTTPTPGTEGPPKPWAFLPSQPPRGH